MVIVVEVILDATVALIDSPAGLDRTLIGGLGGPQVVTERLYVKVQAHCAKSHVHFARLHLKVEE